MMSMAFNFNPNLNNANDFHHAKLLINLILYQRMPLLVTLIYSYKIKSLSNHNTMRIKKITRPFTQFYKFMSGNSRMRTSCLRLSRGHVIKMATMERV